MPAGFSYEPSIEAIWAEVNLPGSSMAGTRESLRRRVSWPVMVRATGIGRIEGGEIILAPMGRTSEVLNHLPDLGRRGVAAVIVTEPLSEAQQKEAVAAGVPIGTLESVSDLRTLQDELEWAILRLRRELFEAYQRFHGLLVEAALAGVELRQLLVAAARECEGAALLDREGDVLIEGKRVESFGHDAVVRARVACRDVDDGYVYVAGPPEMLTRPIFAGRDRAGIVGLLQMERGDADRLETLLTVLATACTIAIARVPVTTPAEPQELFEPDATGEDAERLRDERSDWTAVAAIDPAESPARVEKALTTELRARDVGWVSARYGQISIAWVNSAGSFPWETVLTSVKTRLGTSSLTAGLSRRLKGRLGAQRAYREALDALVRGDGKLLTRFDSIELDAVLSRAPGGRELAEASLGPLLRRRSGETLVGTLETYLATGQNARHASEILSVHRNTLLYRLRQIETVLGVSLDDPEATFRLDLACRIRAAARRTPNGDNPNYRNAR